MEKSLSFFRVFDIAFFAPGTLLFAAIWYYFFPFFHEIAVAPCASLASRIKLEHLHGEK